MRNKIEGEICITRPSYSDGRKLISISISDKRAGIDFLEIEISYENFVMALTSSAAGCDLDIGGLENVGKVLEQQGISFKMPSGFDYVNRGQAASDEAQRLAPDGWAADNRATFSREDGVDMATVTLYRWVDREAGGEP